MDWFWHVLLVCAVVIPVTVLWISIIVELFRRHDISGLARATWLVVLFVLPLFGAFLYVIVTWRRGSQDSKKPAYVDPAHASSVSDLSELDKERRAGDITEEEFDEASRRVLKGAPGRHTSDGSGS
jgi:uncharacterized membrane protein